jgi:Zn-dependent protease
MDQLNPIQKLSVYFVPFFMAVVFHEFAHGWAATRFGDTTARDQGRLTLNPVPHVDIMGTLILPVIMMLSGANILFGWAKPVPIDPRRFSKYRAGLFWVSFAGPLMNFLLAWISAAAFALVVLFVPQSSFLAEPLQWMTSISVYLNYGIESMLNANAIRFYERLAEYSFWILTLLILTGALSFLGWPVQFMGRLTLETTAKLFGIAGL